ncbi:hypothetical protein EVAR_100597_1 [Eumeta japonica]|uniref:Uncharacterized protein n=1 Tax=Eumeta variegata TaxID=151549 RepID=A0A4C2A2W4_EUMVA|nr:hypothetical protein EVAR_100597_1 [Eumeta japonica]
MIETKVDNSVNYSNLSKFDRFGGDALPQINSDPLLTHGALMRAAEGDGGGWRRRGGAEHGFVTISGGG